MIVMAAIVEKLLSRDSELRDEVIAHIQKLDTSEDPEWNEDLAQVLKWLRRI